MTLEEYRERVKNLITELSTKKAADVLLPPAMKMLAQRKNAIVREGKATDGSKIGDYSRDPMYANKQAFDKKGAFKPQGKNGYKGEKVVDAKIYKVQKVKLKNGKIQERIVNTGKKKIEKTKPKSMYLEEGYSELRGVQGKPNDKTNLNYTGSTIASYVTAVEDDNTLIQGFNNERSSIIRQAHETKYKKKIYPPSAEEKAEYQKGVAEEITRLQKQILKGV